MLKKLFIYLFLFVFLFDCQAIAQEDNLCRFLDKTENGAEYVPGLDVHGKAVVPADLNATVPNLPDVINIPMTVDMAERVQQQLPEGLELDAGLGMIEIYRDGQVIYNGVDLTALSQDICSPEAKIRKVVIPSRKPEKTSTELNEQSQPDSDVFWGEGY